MKKTLIRRIGWIGLVALATSVASAQGTEESGFSSALKLRAGFGLSAPEDNTNRSLLGLGFEFGYGFAWGRLSAELGYQYKPGNQYMTDVSTMPTAPGMTVDPSQSVDSRKNQLSGVMGRFSYERHMAEHPFSWRLGVQVGGTKFRQEYIGDVTNGTTYEDTYNGTVSQNSTALSPFVGMSWDIDRDQKLELNLLALNYTSANYVHVAGTVPNGSGGHTAWDYVATQKRTVPHLELCYVLRF